MNGIYWVGGIISVLLLAYLTIGLLRPEWFE
jgi:K+-transporting ATPase KdpF subunit